MTDRDKIIEMAMGDVLIPGSSTIPASMVISRELMARMAQAARAAYESHLQASWMAVVPVEPTQAMIEAGLDHVTRGDIWRAMLSASPSFNPVAQEKMDE